VTLMLKGSLIAKIGAFFARLVGGGDSTTWA
jgi:hypothetical protein